MRTFNMCTTADAMVANTINDCLNGDKIVTPKDTSYEQLWYSTGISEPQYRVSVNEARPLNIVVAVARFLWLAAGNNRVQDIAYYEPKVFGFSDDGLTVPGSDYGMRLFQPRPGLNQIKGVVERLARDGGSRQAAAVVWQPEDAVRESRDIPCTFGFFFHVRQAVSMVTPPQLVMSVNMRSNNAFRILPFNVFEFTMLQEVVAAELELPLGAYHHWAASMHVYQNQREWEPTVAYAKSWRDNGVPQSIRMPSMPSGSALDQLEKVCMYEAMLRHAPTRKEYDNTLDAARAVLQDYWFRLLSIPACYVAARHGWDPYYTNVFPELVDMTAAVCQRVNA